MASAEPQDLPTVIDDLNQTGLKGYDYDFVDENVASNYECAICLLVSRDPKLVVPCGHMYCGSCLDQWMFENDNHRCPGDNAHIQPSDVVDDKKSGRMIRCLAVYCTNRGEGCAHTSTVDDLEAHLSICLVTALKKRHSENDELRRQHAEVTDNLLEETKRCGVFMSDIDQLRVEKDNMNRENTKNLEIIEKRAAEIKHWKEQYEEQKVMAYQLSLDVGKLQSDIKTSIEKFDGQNEQFSLERSRLEEGIQTKDARIHELDKIVQKLEGENGGLNATILGLQTELDVAGKQHLMEERVLKKRLEEKISEIEKEKSTTETEISKLTVERDIIDQNRNELLENFVRKNEELDKLSHEYTELVGSCVEKDDKIKKLEDDCSDSMNNVVLLDERIENLESSLRTKEMEHIQLMVQNVQLVSCISSQSEVIDDMSALQQSVDDSASASAAAVVSAIGEDNTENIAGNDT